jgi:DNA polymerase-3 subunit gamma/tau
LKTSTPYTIQSARKEKAFHRAAELLQQQPVIKSLIETFDGELQNIQLKP